MKIKLTVIKQKGKCPRNFKVGDEFIIDDGKTPKAMCGSAFNSLWPFAKTLLITKNKKDECSIICPDGVLEYKLELIEE